ncbi:MAG: hypothetical protein ACTH31_15830 [Pseudoclavibacter sp.]
MTAIDQAPGSAPTAERRTPLPARLASVWRTDLAPTLLGIALWVVIAVAIMLVVLSLIPFGAGDASVTIGSIPDAAAGYVIVAGIMVGCFGSTGRREAILGGWSRRDQLEVRAVIAAASAVLASVLWTVFALLRLDLNPLFGVITGAPFGGQVPQFSALGAVLVAAIAVGGVFVPALLVGLARIHWLMVWLGSAVLLVWVIALLSAYGMFAYSVDTIAVESATARGTGASIAAAVGLVGTVAVVIGSIFASRRAPIKRYG